MQPRRKLRVGVLELLRHPTTGPAAALDARLYRRMQVALTPQAVSVWCRQLGHETYYATHYGIGDPLDALPSDLDVLFVSSHTYTAPTAYGISIVYRKAGTLTVIGGPHSRCFPADCLRYFDIAVVDCDRHVVGDILAGQHAPGSVVSSPKPYDDPPTVEERLPELRRSSLAARGGGLVPILASVGCPYRCDFCVDWNTDYQSLSLDRLREDLAFLDRYPRARVHFQDPNFAVRFNEVMDVLESVPPSRRHPYFTASAMSNLRPDRLQRLKDTRCQFLCQGVESWSAYSDKAHVAGATGRTKLEQVSAQLRLTSGYVSYMQATFILGLDCDQGSAPFDLTREFIRSNPYAWPHVNLPVPYGATPLHDELAQAGRLLTAMPLVCYHQPYLTFRLQNYDALTFYEQLLRVEETAAALGMMARRVVASHAWYGKRSQVVQTMRARRVPPVLRALIAELKSNPQFRAFHEGADVPLPDFYARLYQKRLGRLAELLPVSESRPLLEPVKLAGQASVELHGVGEPGIARRRVAHPRSTRTTAL